MSTPKVIAAVLNWNGKNHLEAYFDELLHSVGEQVEVVLIDNDSTDGSVEFIESKYGNDIPIVQTGANLGYAGGYNAGLKELEADYFILINSDIRAEKGWVAPLLELLESDPTIAAVQPKILSLNQPDEFEYAGAAGGYIDYLGYPFCRGRIFEHLEKDNGQYNDVKEIFWSSGACFVVRADLFKSVGGFDDTYFAHMEEIDLCWRLSNLGYKIMYNGTSEVFHLGGGSLAYGNPRKTFLNFRNSLLTNFKNMHASELWWKLPFRLILDGLAATKVLLEGKPKDFGAIFRAHISFYSLLPAYLKKRKAIKKKILLNEKQAVYGASIVKASFIDKKSSFSDLNANDL